MPGSCYLWAVEKRGFFFYIANFFGYLFEYLAAASLAFVSIFFLGLAFFVALGNISWDNIFYYLPFLLVPPLVVLLFFSPFSAKEK